MTGFFTKQRMMGTAVLVLFIIFFGLFFYALRPVQANALVVTSGVFEIMPGESSRTITNDLAAAHLVRSAVATEIFALLAGRSFKMQPGLYHLSPAMSVPAIVGSISGPLAKTVSVTIPEGSNVYQIDAILSNALVIHHGALIAYVAAENVAGTDLEGTLFPDTYQVYTDMSPVTVVQKMTEDFKAKAAALLPGGSSDSSAAKTDLVLASILEKEVPDQQDQEIVAGILLKRINAGMPLDVDATVCYAMQIAAGPAGSACDPLDLQIDSAYNTYLYKGLPPGPIGNPGVSAIQAALHPESSPYWFYLSDPKTGKTIFAETLDEQHQNTVKYLDNG